MCNFKTIIETMSDEQLNIAYEQNATDRRNSMTCIIEKHASIELQMLFDSEVAKRSNAKKAQLLLGVMAKQTSLNISKQDEYGSFLTKDCFD